MSAKPSTSPTEGALDGRPLQDRVVLVAGAGGIGDGAAPSSWHYRAKRRDPAAARGGAVKRFVRAVRVGDPES